MDDQEYVIESAAFDADVCGKSAAFVPYVLALPYIWRFFQCLIVAHANNDNGQVLNAIKYTTALPVVFLNFVKYSVPMHAWRQFWKPLWLASAFVNTSYSFYWDVERDWDIRLFTPGAMSSLSVAFMNPMNAISFLPHADHRAPQSLSHYDKLLNAASVQNSHSTATVCHRPCPSVEITTHV